MSQDLASLDKPRAEVLGPVPFVGRRQETDAFRTALQQLSARRGSLLMLTGAPGVGKTRTAKRFSTLAEADGIDVFWGVCREQAGMPPYWPWSECLRALLRALPPEEREALCAGDAEQLAAFLPELSAQAKRPDYEGLGSVAEESRFPIYDSLLRLLERRAGANRLMIVIDNLHLADTPSLRILEFIAPELESHGIIFVGTYRDIELSRSHPLSETLGRLVSQSGFRRIRLGGLEADEVATFAENLCGHAVPAGLIAAIHRQTEGNPFYVGEVVRHLIECNYLGADRAAPLPESVMVPEGVREAIGQRLNRLSERSNALLANAAILGREFAISELTALASDFPEPELNAALEEAAAARIIETDTGQIGLFRFSHALIRETVYDETPATLRIRLHARAADVIEAAGANDTPETLARLAHHSFQGQLIAGTDKVVAYARRAAGHATKIKAYEDAAHYLELAIDCLEMSARTPTRERCELRLLLGVARHRAGEIFPALDACRTVTAEAEMLGETQLFAEAALAFERTRFSPGLPGHESAELLARALDRVGRDDPQRRSLLLGARAHALSFTENDGEAPALARESVRLARAHGDKRHLRRVLHDAWLAFRRRIDYADERLEYNREQLKLAVEIGDPEMIADAHAQMHTGLLEIGAMREFEASLTEFERLTRQLRQPHFVFQCAFIATMRALLIGDFERAAALAERALKHGAQVQGSDADGLYAMQVFAIYRELGRLPEIAPLLDTILNDADDGALWQPGLALVKAELGDLDTAGRLLRDLAAGGFSALHNDELRLTSLAFLADVCGMVRDKAAAGGLLEQLSPYAGRNIVLGAGILCLGPADRVLGVLAGVLGRWDVAEQHFEQALNMCANLGGAPLSLRTTCDFAEMLLHRGTNKAARRASELLAPLPDAAAKLGMAGLRRRADALRAGKRIVGVGPRGEALTAREVEVLRLIAEGRSNRNIADALCVSMPTVATHVRNILAKTETSNRTAAAAYARAQGLIV